MLGNRDDNDVIWIKLIFYFPARFLPVTSPVCYRPWRNRSSQTTSQRPSSFRRPSGRPGSPTPPSVRAPNEASRMRATPRVCFSWKVDPEVSHLCTISKLPSYRKVTCKGPYVFHWPVEYSIMMCSVLPSKYHLHCKHWIWADTKAKNELYIRGT